MTDKVEKLAREILYSLPVRFLRKRRPVSVVTFLPKVGNRLFLRDCLAAIQVPWI